MGVWLVLSRPVIMIISMRYSRRGRQERGGKGRNENSFVQEKLMLAWLLDRHLWIFPEQMMGQGMATDREARCRPRRNMKWDGKTDLAGLDKNRSRSLVLMEESRERG